MEPCASQPEKGYIPPEQSWKDRILWYFKGLLIGIGAILPGLSGGVLAVIFKLYDPIMRFLARPFFHFGRNLLYFLPAILGGGSGILLFAFVVSAALGAYEAFFTCLFIGLVVGTLPSLFKEAGKEGRRKSDLPLMLCSTALIIALMLLGGQKFTQINPSFPVWLMAGAIIGLGFIVPGLSPSNFLIYFGLYKPMSDAIKNLDITAVLPLVLGAAASILLLARGVNHLLNRHYSSLYALILGLVIGTSIGIFPAVVFPGLQPSKLEAMGLSPAAAALLCLLFFGLGLLAARLFSLLEKRVD